MMLSYFSIGQMGFYYRRYLQLFTQGCSYFF